MSKAMELADELDGGVPWVGPKRIEPLPYQAAAELRRLEAETVRLAAQLAEEKLRADRMTEQYRMQAEICAKAQSELAAIRALEIFGYWFTGEKRFASVSEARTYFDDSEQKEMLKTLYALPEQK